MNRSPKRVEKAWRQGFKDLQSGALDPRNLAARVAKAAQTNSPAAGRTRREAILRMLRQIRR